MPKEHIATDSLFGAPPVQSTHSRLDTSCAKWLVLGQDAVFNPHTGGNISVVFHVLTWSVFSVCLLLFLLFLIAVHVFVYLFLICVGVCVC